MKNNKINNSQLHEGMASVNVDEKIDVSRIRVLAGLANSSTAAGTPVTFNENNPNEYDQEGAMAKQDLATAADAANELRSILDSSENLPEWVQAKITKAVDYLDSARDYIKSKE